MTKVIDVDLATVKFKEIADAQGPSVKPMGRYKRTPAEWMPVWRDVADRLLKKLKEVNRALKED